MILLKSEAVLYILDLYVHILKLAERAPALQLQLGGCWFVTERDALNPFLFGRSPVRIR